MERVDEEADEIIIDKIAGGEAVHDKIARDEAVHDNTAGERVEEFTVDPSIEAILEAAERIDEEAGEVFIEETVINSIIESTIDKIAGGEAILDKVARGEAARDKSAEEGKACT